MRKFIVTLMASLLSCSAAWAFWPEAAESSLEIGVGYRQDRLEWKTKNHFDSPGYNCYEDKSCYEIPTRVSSHLKWRDLDIWLIEARGKYVTCDNIYLRANGDYGWITHGKCRDRDFVSFRGYDDDSDSSSEFSRSRARARGHVYDARIALGYQFRLCDDSLSVDPVVGYSWHGQHIEDRHLRQHSSSSSECSDDLRNTYGSSSSSSGRKHARYHTRWNGPFIGFDFDYRFGCCCEWTIFGDYEFHWAHYHARARWHLRDDFIDGRFRHHAKNAYGHIFDIGVRYDFCECWFASVKGEFQWWWADRGHDRAKIFEASCGDASTNCRLSIPLRDVRWDSYAVIADVGMTF
jgi:hypothetical protein